MYTVEAHSVPQTDGARSWGALTMAIHCSMALGFADAAGFRGRLERQASDSFELVQWWSDAVRFERSAGHIARDERGTVELLVPVTGSAVVEHATAREVLRPHDLALYPIDRPVSLLHGSDFSAITLIIPAGRVESRGAELSAVRLLEGAGGLGRIIRDMVGGLRSEQATLSAPAFDAVCDRVVDLTCLLATAAVDPELDSAHRADVEASVRGYVRDHAEDEDLSSHQVAAALGWSLRYVQAVLHDAGTTPRTLIREERLALARQRLENARYRTWPIERIGRSCGFRSASAFTAAFRAEFGMTPGEIRTH